MSRRLEDLEPDTRAKCEALLAAAAAELRVPVILTHTLRTFEEQAHLFAQGRAIPGKPIVTNAPAGASWHNYGRAFDLCFLTVSGRATWNGPWDKLAAIGKRYGLVWGGDFKRLKDRPHFENQGGLTLKQAKAQMPGGWKGAA